MVTAPRPPYGHVGALLRLCRCGGGYITALLDDETPVCASCSLKEEKK